MPNLIVISSIIFPVCMWVFNCKEWVWEIVKTQVLKEAQVSKDEQVDFTSVSWEAYPRKKPCVEHMIGRWRVVLGCTISRVSCE